MQKYKEAILFVIFITIGFIYALASLRPRIVDIFTVEKDLSTKSIEYADLERKLETLKASEIANMSTSDQTKNIYKPEIPGMDAESSFTVIFDDIIEMAKYNGIKIYSIEYVYNPAEDEFVKGVGSQYNVCQLNMQIIADYPDLESFLKEIYKYPYLINIDKLELAPYNRNKKILLAKLQLKLYSSK
ncbi:MAG: hypothetical protein WCY19_03045 [Candidatus Gastranaerophilaceae bacterium]